MHKVYFQKKHGNLYRRGVRDEEYEEYDKENKDELFAER